MDRENLIDIDLMNLHEELLDQPKLYRQYADLTAEAELDLNQAEAALELVESKLRLDIRRRPKKYGISRVTEGVIKEVVTTLDKYQNAQDDVHRIKHKVSKLKGILRTLEHRKTSLENLVILQGRDYWAEVYGPREVRRQSLPKYDREEHNRKK